VHRADPLRRGAAALGPAAVEAGYRGDEVGVPVAELREPQEEPDLRGPGGPGVPAAADREHPFPQVDAVLREQHRRAVRPLREQPHQRARPVGRGVHEVGLEDRHAQRAQEVLHQLGDGEGVADREGPRVGADPVPGPHLEEQVDGPLPAQQRDQRRVRGDGVQCAHGGLERERGVRAVVAQRRLEQLLVGDHEAGLEPPRHAPGAGRGRPQADALHGGHVLRDGEDGGLAPRPGQRDDLERDVGQAADQLLAPAAHAAGLDRVGAFGDEGDLHCCSSLVVGRVRVRGPSTGNQPERTVP
jgi:hypothetical protein